MVIGIGLLNWLTPSGQKVCRHLVTGEASISIDPDTGTLSVKVGIEGPKAILEQDMLEVSEQPALDTQKEISEIIANINDDFWDKENLELALRSWVQTVSSDGQYEDENKPSLDAQKSPKVTFTPALILRKRSEKNLIKMYQEIIEQIEHDDSHIPMGIQRTVEILDDNQEHEKEKVYDENKNQIISNQTNYLPLAANDEQLKIIQQIKNRQGVIVQGPPGTGKSHTIANLICHLLATGNKILITSQTPRALKVLKEKIPKQIQNLCVSLLGHDKRSTKDLEDVVQGIINEQYNWDSGKAKYNIKRLDQTLEELYQEKALIDTNIREIREIETFKYRVIDGAYNGTAQQIAEKLNEQQEELGWITNTLALNVKIPLENHEALEMLQLSRYFTSDLIKEMSFKFPMLHDIPTPEDFKDLVKIELKEKTELDQYGDISEISSYRILSGKSVTERNNLEKQLNDFITHKNQLLKNDHEWVEESIKDILSNRHKSWEELYSRLKSGLEGLRDRARKADEQVIKLNDYTRTEVLADAEALIRHFNNGGKFGIPGFRPKPVKTGWYLIKEIKVNGQSCDNPDTLITLIESLTVDEKIEKLLSVWSDQTNQNIKSKSTRSLGVAELESQLEMLENIIILGKKLKDTKELFKTLEGIEEPLWNNDDELITLLRVLKRVELEEDLLEVERLITNGSKSLSECLNHKNCHPVVSSLYTAISNRESEEYRIHFKTLKHINEEKKKLDILNGFYDRLKVGAFPIVHQIKGDPLNEKWDQRLNKFKESWQWTQAKSWLDQLLSKNILELEKRYKKVEDKIRKTKIELTNLKAWEYCFNRLTEPERQHLLAWTKAMNRYGAGSGRHAPHHLQNAKKHMQQCQTAIPAWIMPLYRVAETVEPEPELFDVVIIDEASQSGPEAMFLMYIAKKIIVVGDDMQISPENVGIPRDDINVLQEKFINDLPHFDTLGAENSFFDFTSILFGGRIVLREHFRCMPEIIQFSNSISYPNTPLIPLRQYPPNRLEPVMTIHVRDGYREGRGQSVRNKPEAEALVNKIVKCCEDPKYKEKTFGVISLQGSYQARLIEKMLLDEIGPEEMEKRQIVCGDAYAFQGDERDVIFISLVAAPGETGMRALAGANDRRRFNVAASRAKDQLWLFHTPTTNDFGNKDCLRYQLISYCENPNVQPIEGTREQCETEFEKAVFDRITNRQYRVIPQYEVAGYRIDLVVEGISGRLAVECDGDEWHGPDRYDYDMKRQRNLERCGWTFWRVRGSEFYFDPDRALDSLWSKLEELNIRPSRLDEKDESNKENLSDILEQTKNRSTKMFSPLKIEGNNDNEQRYIQHQSMNQNLMQTIKGIQVNSPLDKGILNRNSQSNILQQSKDSETLTKKSKDKQLSIELKSELTDQASQMSLFEITNQQENFDLRLHLQNKGLDVIDKRATGGSLWVLGGKELSSFFNDLRIKGYHFKFTKNGSRSTKRKPAWYIKD